MALADVANRYVDEQSAVVWLSTKRPRRGPAGHLLDGHQLVPRADDVSESGTADAF